MAARNLSLALIASLWLSAGVTRAESWPALEDLVPRCVLIVHCRTERFEDRVLYKVQDVLKGEYSPLAFEKQPPTGYIDTALGGHGEEREAGRDVILFFTDNNVGTDGKLHGHDMALLIRAGKVAYPPEGGRFDAVEPPVDAEEFKDRIRRLADDGRTAAEAPPLEGRVHTMDDLAGPWRLFLPAGHEQALTLTRLEADGAARYRLGPDQFVFSGVYEVRDDRLVMTVPGDERHHGYEWEIRSPYLLTLVAQPKIGDVYHGGVLFRPTVNEESTPRR